MYVMSMLNVVLREDTFSFSKNVGESIFHFVVFQINASHCFKCGWEPVSFARAIQRINNHKHGKMYVISL